MSPNKISKVIPYYGPSKDEIEIKEKRVRKFLDEKKLDGILLNTVRNFAWMSGGGDNFIVLTTELGASSLLITKDRKYFIGPNDEKVRLEVEELADQGYEFPYYPWFEELYLDQKVKLVSDLTKGLKIGTDSPFGDLPDLGKEFAPLRYILTDQEIERYRWLGKTTVNCVEEVAHELEPGETEADIAAQLCEKFFRWGIYPTVLLIAVDDRIQSYRHALTKTKTLKKHAMLNICVRKWGLVISCTRLVHFGAAPEQIRKHQKITNRVWAQFMAESKVGAKLNAILKKGIEEFTEHGYPEEWTMHSQGGTIGYTEREEMAHPGNELVLQPGMGIAWHPNMSGAKTEDTAVLFKDSVEVITRSGNWPEEIIEKDGQTWHASDLLIR